MPARADALLAATPRTKEAPFYREQTFFLKLIGYKRDIRARRERPELPEFHQLLRSEWCAIIESADLDRDERILLREHLSGLTLALLGRSLGITRQAAVKRFQRVLEKIRASHAVYPYAGLAEAYRNDRKRGKSNLPSGTLQD